MTIRRLTDCDVKTYHALRLRMLREFPSAFVTHYDDVAGKPESSVLPHLGLTPESAENLMLGAFTNDNELVGVAGLLCSSRRNERHRATVVGMYVVPDHSRKGVGMSLLRAVIEAALARPELEQLHLTVTGENVPARELYLKAGFLLSGIEPAATKIDGVYFDKQHMFLPLKTGWSGR